VSIARVAIRNNAYAWAHILPTTINRWRISEYISAQYLSDGAKQQYDFKEQFEGFVASAHCVY